MKLYADGYHALFRGQTSLAEQLLTDAIDLASNDDARSITFAAWPAIAWDVSTRPRTTFAVEARRSVPGRSELGRRWSGFRVVSG